MATLRNPLGGPESAANYTKGDWRSEAKRGTFQDTTSEQSPLIAAKGTSFWSRKQDEYQGAKAQANIANSSHSKQEKAYPEGPPPVYGWASTQADIGPDSVAEHIPTAEPDQSKSRIERIQEFRLRHDYLNKVATTTNAVNNSPYLDGESPYVSPETMPSKKASRRISRGIHLSKPRQSIVSIDFDKFKANAPTCKVEKVSSVMTEDSMKAVVDAFNDCDTMLQRLKVRRVAQELPLPPDSLGRAIERGPRRIKDLVAHGVVEFGSYFTKGDSAAAMALNEVAIRIRNGLLKQLVAAFDEERPDFHNMHMLAESAREAGLSALDELYKRQEGRNAATIAPLGYECDPHLLEQKVSLQSMSYSADRSLRPASSVLTAAGSTVVLPADQITKEVDSKVVKTEEKRSNMKGPALIASGDNDTASNERPDKIWEDSQSLVNEFTEAMLKALNWPSRLGRLTLDPDQLASLLTDFANIVLIGTDSPGQLRRDALFLFAHSRAIAQSIHRKVTPMYVPPLGLPSTLETTQRLLPGVVGESKNINTSPSDQIAISSMPCHVDAPDSSVAHADTEYAFKSLIESDSFSWLQNQILHLGSMLSTGKVYSEIQKTMVSCLPYTSSVTFALNWPLISFFTEQFDQPREVSLESVICVVGTDTIAEATTCGEYVARMWPRAGQIILSRVTKAVHSRLAGTTDYIGSTPEKQHEPLQIEMLPIEEEAMHPVVVTLTSSDKTMLVEGAEVLCWLAAACRRAHHKDRLSYCRPFFSVINSDKFYIGCRFSDIESERQRDDRVVSDACWHQLFRNAAIVQGYPILQRDPGTPGLQLTANLMSILARVDRITMFNGSALLKGLYNMFVPVLKTGNAIVWHYLTNPDRGWMLHSRAAEQCSTIAHVLPSDLFEASCFVGWTRSVDVLAATKNASYDTIGYRGAVAPKSGMSLESISITASYGIGIGFEAVPGLKDTPLFLVGYDGYEEKMHLMAKHLDVVVYDTADQRGFLLDGATALLHMTRACITHEESPLKMLDSGKVSRRLVESFQYPKDPERGLQSAYDALLSTRNRKIPIREPKSDTESGPSEAAADEPRGKENMRTLEDLILRHFETLEQIKAHQIQRAFRPEVAIESPWATSLPGWAFLDLISGETTVRPRVAQLKESAAKWVKFTDKAGAICILGSNLGDLVWPYSVDCKASIGVPCGKSFLAAPVERLRRIAAKSGYSDDPNHLQLSDDVFWNDPISSFYDLPCGCMKTPSPIQRCSRNPITELQAGPPSTKLRKRFLRHLIKKEAAKEDVLQTCSHGAIIIGRRKDWKASIAPTGAGETLSQSSTRDSGYGTGNSSDMARETADVLLEL